MAVPKRFKFKTKKLSYKKINNNSTYILSLRNKKAINNLKYFL